MNPNKIEKFQKEIEKTILNKGAKDNLKPACNPISDGVINADLYSKSKCRIVWALKEPWDEIDSTTGRPYGGDWFIGANLDNESIVNGNTTWKQMSRTSYAIINSLSNNDIDNIEHFSCAKAMREIAIVNASKYPGGTTTNNSELKKISKQWMPINIKQIEAYEPQVVICGYTGHLYEDTMRFSFKYDEEFSIKYFIKNGCIYLDAYHPSLLFKSNEEKKHYIKTLAGMIRKYSEKIGLKEQKKSSGLFGFFKK